MSASNLQPPSAPAPVREGDLHWRLSDHPLTLLMFLGFRIAPMFVYLFGMFVTENFVLIFIITILLLSADFYYTKNIAGRRLVGLRWWNETDQSGAQSIWVFESSDPSRRINATDSRFFWLSLYIVPVLWFVLAIVAIVKIHWIWLSLVIIALILSVTNGVAFSRADKFGNASSLAGTAMGTGLVNRFAGSFVSRMLFRS